MDLHRSVLSPGLQLDWAGAVAQRIVDHVADRLVDPQPVSVEGELGPEGSRLSSGAAAGSDEQFDVIEGLEAFAAARGVGILDVAIDGLAELDRVAPR